MSNDKVQNIWHWGFGLDLTFEIWALTFHYPGKTVGSATQPTTHIFLLLASAI
jgi:hypothetical protein